MPFMYIKFVMTLLCAFTFCGGFQHYYFSSRFRNGKKKKKKTLPKLECADKKILEESCVRNFRNPLFAKLLLFEILGHFQKLFWAKILGVRNFRVFEILGHLPYWKNVACHLHICSGGFTQVSELWPVGLVLFLFFF